MSSEGVLVRAWADLPAGRVLRLVGAGPDAIMRSLAPLPDDAPAVVMVRVGVAGSLASMIDTVLGDLEAHAVDLLPAWLPGSDGIIGHGRVNVAAARVLALRLASASDHFGPFVAHLATRALTGRATIRSMHYPEVRAAGLARVIAAGLGRSRVAVLVYVLDEFPVAAEPVLVAGCEWLVGWTGLGVWFTGRPLTSIDHIEAVTVPLPQALEPDAVGPAVAGLPHHRSEAERALESALARCDWSAGRAWNQTFWLDPLANPIRVDLLWSAEKCAIEIDGDEHRLPGPFADDRRRDVQMQLHGYAVLRFTNGQILSDIKAVVGQIEQLVRGRRPGMAEGRQHAG